MHETLLHSSGPTYASVETYFFCYFSGFLFFLIYIDNYYVTCLK